MVVTSSVQTLQALAVHVRQATLPIAEHSAGRRRLSVQLVMLLLVCLLPLLSACGQPTIQPLTFEPPPWRAEEVSEYAITDVNGAPAGTARYEITQGALPDQADGWTMVRTVAAQGVNEVVTVAMSSTLRPISSRMVRTNDQQRQESVVAIFANGQVNMELTTVENVTTYQQVNIPSDAREGNMLLPVARALPLASGYATRMNAFLPVAGLLETFVVTVQGTEQVSVPAGTFDSYKVELRSKDYSTTAWYTQDEAHTLVKYVDGRNQGEYVLTNYQPGE